MNVIPFDRAAYDGFIFDCDGTLADSMPVHYRAWRQTLENKLGRVPEEISWPFFQNFGGVPANVIVEQWNREFGYGLPVEETVREKAEAFLRLLDEVRPMPEVLAVVKELAGRPGAKVAVASSGLTRVIEKIVRHFGLAIGVDGEIKAVVCADQVARGIAGARFVFARGRIARRAAGALPGLRGRRLGFSRRARGGHGLPRCAALSGRRRDDIVSRSVILSWSKDQFSLPSVLAPWPSKNPC